MIEIGNYNRLCVVGLVDQGAYLDGGEKGEVFLPRKHFAKGSVREGAYMQVFVTRDVSGPGKILDPPLDLPKSFRDPKKKIQNIKFWDPL